MYALIRDRRRFQLTAIIRVGNVTVKIEAKREIAKLAKCLHRQMRRFVRRHCADKDNTQWIGIEARRYTRLIAGTWDTVTNQMQPFVGDTEASQTAQHFAGRRDNRSDLVER